MTEYITNKNNNTIERWAMRETMEGDKSKL
jgi:hypothetical protein